VIYLTLFPGFNALMWRWEAAATRIPQDVDASYTTRAIITLLAISVWVIGDLILVFVGLYLAARSPRPTATPSSQAPATPGIDAAEPGWFGGGGGRLPGGGGGGGSGYIGSLALKGSFPTSATPGEATRRVS
jgi:hypothetical protein